MLELFKESLQTKVLSTNDLGNGLKFRKKEKAIAFSHLATNQLYRKFIVLDIDQPWSAFLWEERGMPVPSLVVISPDTGRCHYLYALETPVIYTEAGRRLPQKLYEAVDLGLTRRVGADLSYVGLITKNPLHPRWKVIQHNAVYDLRQLAEYVDITRTKLDRTNPLGRNCTLFDCLRFWAYPTVRMQTTFEPWQAMADQKAISINCNFPDPLPAKEVLSVAKSVGQWTWRNRFNPYKNRGIMQLEKDMPLHYKQVLAGKYSSQKEASNTLTKLLTVAKEMQFKGQKITQPELVKSSNLSRFAVQKYWQQISETLSLYA